MQLSDLEGIREQVPLDGEGTSQEIVQTTKILSDG